MILFLIFLSLTFEEEKLINFLKPLMLQTKGEIKLEKKISGENFSIYYAKKEGEEKGKEEMIPCAIYEGKNVIYGMYFGLKNENKPTPEFLSSFLKNVFLSSIKVEKDENSGKNLKSFKVFQETGYGKVKMKAYLLAEKHLFIGNIYKLDEKIDEIIMEKINWELGGKIGSSNSKNKLLFFLDLECPYCSKLEKEILPILKEKKDLFSGFFLFPLSIHILSFKGSAAGYCFKKMGDDFFFDYINWFYEERGNIELENIDLKIYQFAQEKNIEKEFLECYMKPENIKTVLEAIQMGIELNVQATPTVFYNGKKYPPKTLIEMLKSDK